MVPVEIDGDKVLDLIDKLYNLLKLKYQPKIIISHEETRKVL